MNFSRTMAMPAIIIGMLLTNIAAADQAITGAAKVKLLGPITQEQMDICKLDAKKKLKPQVLLWLEEQKSLRIDTTDLLTDLLFMSFLDSCVIRAKETSAFQEKFWIFSYSITPEAMESALTAYNDRIDLLAVHSWKRLQNAIDSKNYEETYYQCVEVIAYATAYLGPLLTVQGDSNKILLEEARGILKDFLERLKITSSSQIIEGKPGYPPVKPPTLNVTIDGHPFAGLGITGYIPGGSDVFSGVADNNGTVSFENLLIPFIRNGTMMYITPNLGRVINNKWRVEMKDFGIKIANDLNETFFFKIEKPSFTLGFEATTADPTDTLPKEFVSGASMKKFLVDSCGLLPAAGPAVADLSIIVKCQISCAQSSAFEGSQARFTGSVQLLAQQLTPPRNETESIVFEKKYDKVPFELVNRKDLDKEPKIVPIGAFVWESNKKLRAAVRNLLNRM